jgi:hypothetical protein
MDWFSPPQYGHRIIALTGWSGAPQFLQFIVMATEGQVDRYPQLKTERSLFSIVSGM